MHYARCVRSRHSRSCPFLDHLTGGTWPSHSQPAAAVLATAVAVAVAVALSAVVGVEARSPKSPMRLRRLRSLRRPICASFVSAELPMRYAFDRRRVARTIGSSTFAVFRTASPMFLTLRVSSALGWTTHLGTLGVGCGRRATRGIVRTAGTRDVARGALG